MQQFCILKELIEGVLGVKASRRTLYFNDDDQDLDNTKTVESYNLIGGDTLTLDLTPPAGDPKTGTKNVTVNVKETDLVKDLKEDGLFLPLTYHGQKMKTIFLSLHI